MKFIPTAIHSSEAGFRGYNHWLRSTIRFYYAEKFFRGFTFVWLYWIVDKFEQLKDRPLSLFSPNNYLAELTMPVFPEQTVFWVVAALVVLGNGWQLFSRTSVAWQGMVAAGLLWLNLLPWSYGAQSHVNHLFLLAHLFLIFVSVPKPGRQEPDLYQTKAITWFYRGLLFTYTLAGLWKVPALLYKLVTSSTEVHWLRPEAALFNARVSFLEYDLPLPFPELFVSYSWVWQLGFVLVVYLQVAAVFAAGRPPLLPWVGAALIGFHLVNQFGFLVYFVVACLTLLLLFFPYDAFTGHYLQFSKPVLGPSFTGSKQHARYTRHYTGMVAETYKGFEAYRQHLLDTHYYLSGILYLPGLRTLVEAWWRVQNRFIKSPAEAKPVKSQNAAN